MNVSVQERAAASGVGLRVRLPIRGLTWLPAFLRALKFESNGAGAGHMIRNVFFLIVAITAPLSIAHAQESRTAGHKGTAEQQRACRSDALHFCRGIHEDEAIYACLKTNIAKLRSSCREVIEGGR